MINSEVDKQNESLDLMNDMFEKHKQEKEKMKSDPIDVSILPVTNPCNGYTKDSISEKIANYQNPKPDLEYLMKDFASNNQSCRVPKLILELNSIFLYNEMKIRVILHLDWNQVDVGWENLEYKYPLSCISDNRWYKFKKEFPNINRIRISNASLNTEEDRATLFWFAFHGFDVHLNDYSLCDIQLLTKLLKILYLGIQPNEYPDAPKGKIRYWNKSDWIQIHYIQK
jgi:hypothetical protein